MNIKPILICALLLLTSCVQNAPEKPEKKPDNGATAEAVELENEEAAPFAEESEVNDEISAFLKKKEFVADVVNNMTLEEKVGQMFICSFEIDEDGVPITEIDKKTAETVEKYNLGGIVYFAANIDDAEQTRKLSDDFQSISKIPAFIAVDEEGGRVSRITRSGKIDFEKTPPAKVIGNTGDREKAYNAASAIAEELNKLGINLNFAPCADIDASDDGAIGDRAFSDDHNIAAEFVHKSVIGYIDNGIICCLKHFPGHGAAPADTHEDRSVSQKSFEELQASDIIPFIEGTTVGAPMIMMSHITVPEWGVPASVSVDAVKYIRSEMGFEGVIVTDSFRMSAITNYYTSEEAAVAAIDAGVNIVLMPEDIDGAVSGVVSAVLDGKLNKDKIDYSVEKIISLKYDYGLFDR